MGIVGEAIKNAYLEEDKIPIGIFYKNELVPTYEERIKEYIPDYLENYPAIHTIEKNGKPITSIERMLDARSVA